ncbi:hypothetical protein L6R29_24055 [Myxococcota bacterium]|nr:hypothetical protein [Myxococcota bacterium]
MPLHLALLTLQRWQLGLPYNSEELSHACKTFQKAIQSVCRRKSAFSALSSSDKEEVESDLFSVLLSRLKQDKDFPTENKAYGWLILSIGGFLKDRYDKQKHLTFFADFRNDEHSDQEPEWQDDSSPNPEELLEQLQQTTALAAFQKQKDAFIASFLQTLSEQKRPQKRQTIKEMEDIHFYQTCTAEELAQQSGKKTNTLHQRHCRLRADLQAHLHGPPCQQIPAHERQTLFAWLALLDGKPGIKYDP